MFSLQNQSLEFGEVRSSSCVVVRARALNEKISGFTKIHLLSLERVPAPARPEFSHAPFPKWSTRPGSYLNSGFQLVLLTQDPQSGRTLPFADDRYTRNETSQLRSLIVAIRVGQARGGGFSWLEEPAARARNRLATKLVKNRWTLLFPQLRSGGFSGTFCVLKAQTPLRFIYTHFRM